MLGQWNMLDWLKFGEQTMSSGVLLVAFDSVTDQGTTLLYTELAKISAALVRKHLRLPVAIVSDVEVDGFDENIIVSKPLCDTRHVFLGDTHQSYNWYNNHRRQLYELTPFDRTLLLDVDYFLQSDRYLACFEQDSPFQIVGEVYDPTGRNSFDRYARLPNRTIPQMWATAIYWNRAASTHFEYANMIAENYTYYSKVFGFSHKQYRNDMVFSIVAHMLPSCVMPWRMWMTSGDCELIDVDQSGMKFQYNNNVVRVNNDVHVLNKNIMQPANLQKLQHWSNYAC